MKVMGYHISVKQISAAELSEVAKDTRFLSGYWDDKTLTIYLLKRDGVKEKRRTLWHELDHAITDLRDSE